MVTEETLVGSISWQSEVRVLPRVVSMGQILCMDAAMKALTLYKYYSLT